MKKFLSIILVSSLLMVTCVWAEGRRTPINISFVPPIGLFNNAVVKGLDLSFCIAESKKVYGIQFCPGIAMVHESCKGIQIGGWNITDNYFGGIQIGAVANTNKDTIGFQLSFYNKTEKITGIQLGAVNRAKTCNGLQIGIVNYCNKLRGIQLGVINLAEYSKLISFMPIINVGW